ncbi:MAG: RnfABCDGE type electron transport complex subunit D [Peptococcaceae bacterium]|nr:RnfABCDGE type electron transport complex subunit D [Peptococcaceae bacterium]
MNATGTVPRSRSYSRKVVITPKILVLVILLGMTVIAARLNPADSRGIVNAGIAMLTAGILDLSVALWHGRKLSFPDGGIVTGLIVALVLSSSAHWYTVVATTVIALASKHLFKIKRRPIFNPAAFGLLAAIILFSSDQSWWGAFNNLSGWWVVPLLAVGFFVTNRVNKFPQVFAFLLTYLSLLLVMGLWHLGHAGDILRNPFINSALFLAFFMVTDPPTSPGKYPDQMLFGVIIAVSTLAIYWKYGGLAFLPAGLLVANVWNAVRMSRTAAKLAE